jgi:hypothetical protein
MRNKPFFDCHHHSSLVKAAMNAAGVCKLRNAPQFLLFLLAKA